MTSKAVIRAAMTQRVRRLDVLNSVSESNLTPSQREEKKRLVHLENNRQTARLSRERKHLYVTSLEGRVATMAKHLAALELENAQLRALFESYAVDLDPATAAEVFGVHAPFVVPPPPCIKNDDDMVDQSGLAATLPPPPPLGGPFPPTAMPPPPFAPLGCPQPPMPMVEPGGGMKLPPPMGLPVLPEGAKFDDGIKREDAGIAPMPPPGGGLPPMPPLFAGWPLHPPLFAGWPLHPS